MKFLLLFSFGVLLGTVCCDSKCFNKKFVRCAQIYIPDIKKVYSSCDSLKQQARCLYSAALDCETDFIPEAYWHQDAVHSICDKKSDYIERYRNCFARAVKDNTVCMNKYKSLMKDKTALEGLKEVCKEVDWFGRCLLGDTEDTCGGIASDYLWESDFRYAVKLQKLLCSEVIVPADESIHELVVQGLPRILEYVIAVLSVP